MSEYSFLSLFISCKNLSIIHDFWLTSAESDFFNKYFIIIIIIIKYAPYFYPYQYIVFIVNYKPQFEISKSKLKYSNH